MVKPWILEQQPFIFGDKKDKDRKPLYIVLTCLGVLFILLGALPSDSERETRQVGIWNRYSSVKWGTAQQQQTVFTSTVEEMGKNKGKKPDYGRFIWHSDLHEWDDRKGLGGRLIVIGDVHGMHKAVESVPLSRSSKPNTHPCVQTNAHRTRLLLIPGHPCLRRRSNSQTPFSPILARHTLLPALAKRPFRSRKPRSIRHLLSSLLC